MTWRFYGVSLPFPGSFSHFYFLQCCAVLCCDVLQCAFFFSCSALENQLCDSENISKKLNAYKEISDRILKEFLSLNKFCVVHEVTEKVSQGLKKKS